MAKYVIQDKTQWSGDFAVFWGRDHLGYCTDPNKAHHFDTVAQARSQVKYLGDHKNRFAIWDIATLGENVSAGVKNLDRTKAMKG